MKTRITFLLFISALAICFISCKSEVKTPDVENINIDYKVIRFEKLLYDMDTVLMIESLEKLQQAHPYFSKIYFTQILPLENMESQSDFYMSICKFIDDKKIIKLTDTVGQVFTSFTPIKKDLDHAFKYLKHYFPSQQIPNIYTFVSYFGYQCFIFPDGAKDGIGVGLDMFLGGDYPYKKLDPTNPAFSDYLTMYFEKEHITRRVIEQILDDKMGDVGGSKLIDHMIHNGKKLYLLKKILPFEEDARIFEYTEKQMDWCQSNETNAWAFFVDKQYLYSSDLSMINRYTKPAPTSRNMPAESPGRTANYLGYKIVESYMTDHPEASIHDLMNMRDGTKFLQESKYKPPRI